VLHAPHLILLDFVKRLNYEAPHYAVFSIIIITIIIIIITMLPVSAVSDCERTRDWCERVSYDGGSGWCPNQGPVLWGHYNLTKILPHCCPLFAEPADIKHRRPDRRPRHIHRCVTTQAALQEQLLWRLESYSANSTRLSSQEISHFLWKPKFHYRVHKRPPLVPILSQISPALTLTN